MLKLFYFVLINFLLIQNFNKILTSAKDLPRTRIVGGKPARGGTIPYQIEYEYDGEHWCGGSIIRPSIILLAAHCVKWLDKDKMLIRTGTVKLQRNGVTAKVKEVRVHPNYYVSDYDVALIKLTEDLPINNGTISVIKLAEANSNIPVGTRAKVSGWGYTKENGHPSKHLQYVIVPVLDDKICREKLTDFTDRNLCAGDLYRGGIDACVSDSGGPLVDVKTNIQIGVVANGEGCGRADKPGVYTKVSVIREWIDKTVEELMSTK